MADLEHTLVAAIERTIDGLHRSVDNMGHEVTGLGREVSGMSAKLDGICTTVREHSEAIRALQIADATGQVDVAKQRALDAAERKSGAGFSWLPTVARIAPWIIASLIGIGAYLGSGGDTAAMANAIRAVNDTTIKLSRKIERIEQAQEEVPDAVDD